MNRRSERVFRKRLLIHPTFQLTLIALNWSVITLIFGFLAVQSSRVFSDMIPLTGLSGISAEYAARYLSYQSGRLMAALAWAYGFSMVASGALTLIVSYRFAGPLIRLKGYFLSIGRTAAPAPDLAFRSGDYFSDLPPVVNAALKRLRGEVEAPAASDSPLTRAA